MPSARVSIRAAARHASLVAATGLLAAIAVGGPAAHAQEPGVVYEPGSPSAKEYAIPLEEARTDAGGAVRGSAETRAFGIGITRRGSRGGARGKSDASRGSRSDASRGQAGGAQPPVARTGSRDLTERLVDAEAAAAPTFWKLAPLLLVLLPGLLVGLLLARRGSHQPAS